MTHPFESVRPGRVRYLFLPALTLYAVLQVLFVILDAPLRTAAAPNGIVSFELAGSASAAQAILDSWNAAARLDAAFGLGIDYVFMLAYSTVIGIACIWASRVLAGSRRRLASLGPLLAWGLWLAALCDAAENVALLLQLLRGASSSLAQLAAMCASAKFLLILLGLCYAAYGAFAWAVGRRWETRGLANR